MFGKGAPRCRRCAGAVYAAEEVIGAGSKWHTQCFCCLTCRTRLSSTTLTEKDGEIYCQTCYAKQFGPKGFGIGSQSLTYTGVSVSDGQRSGASAASSPPAAKPAPPAPSAAASPAASASPRSAFCTQCGAANQTGKFCGSCGKPTGVGASAAAAPSPPPAAASPPAAAATFSPNRPGIQRPPTVVMQTSTNKCGACNTTVYEAERVNGGGRVWHSQCFRCSSCRAGLNSTNLNDKDGKIYCNACYAKNFGPKGFGFAGGAAGLMSQ